MGSRSIGDDIGSSPPRPDGMPKATGAARFADDEAVEGLWYGATVRSASPRARIRDVRWHPERAPAGAVCVTARDLPGPNGIPFIDDSWPILASSDIHHVGEAIALVAARTRCEAHAARDAVEVISDPLEPELSFDVVSDTPPLHTASLCMGDVDAVFREARIIVDGEYRTGYQEHVYIECQAMTAHWTADGSLVVSGTMQCPYYVHRALKHAFGLPDGQVRVRASVVGGGFGGKEDYPSLIAVHAALLARAAGAPVRIAYDRHEDIVATSKRHPSVIRHRTAVDEEGRLQAMDVEIVFDGGAYLTLSSVVLSRAVLHATGPYRCPAVRIRGTVRRTNTPPNGAFRGFGAPQVEFAVERQMDRIARTLGLDPFAIRARNVLVAGDRLPTGEQLGHAVAARDCLDAVVDRTRFVERWRKSEALRAAGDEGRLRRGVGLSLFFHGAAFTGSGESKMRSPVTVQLREDGRIEVATVATDMGQGAVVVLPQMTADGAGLRLGDIVMTPADTMVAPDSGPTVASRTTMIVGSVAREAAAELSSRVLAWWRQTCDPSARAVQDGQVVSDEAEAIPFRTVARRYREGVGALAITRRYTASDSRSFDEQTYTGTAYADYSWGAAVVEVEVDQDTFETRVISATTACEIGTPVHPLLAQGQIEGGILQAIGYGLMEEIKTDRGRYLNDRLSTYLIPTIKDAPAMDVLLVDERSDGDRMAPKGVGELPMDGGAPAVTAAIENATGLSASSLPVTPERLSAAPAVESPRVVAMGGDV